MPSQGSTILPPTTRFLGQMLQRGAQGGIQKVILGKKACSKISYSTVAQAIGHSVQNELNAFITRADPPGEEPPDSQDFDIAGGLEQCPPDLQSVAVKDNITTIESGTTCGSGILRQFRSPFEAGVVRCFRQRGASVAGKTNLDEFGMGSHSTHSFYGPVKNLWPFDAFSAGGSSGGSAVAVASGNCPLALGTDTGGSVRLPAAYTGIVGFKPSYGHISRWGVIPYANSMDTVGIMASTVEPLEIALRWVGQHDPRDPTSLSRKSWIRWKKRRNQARKEEHRARGDDMRIGVPLEYNIAELEPGIRQAWRDCLKMLQDQGATIVPVSLPNTKHALSAYYVLAPAEAASNLSKYDGVRYGCRDGSSADGAGDVLYSKTRGEGFGDEVKRRILLGSYTLSSEAVDNYFLKAQKVRRLVQRDFDRAFSAPNPLRPAEQFDLSDMNDSIQMSNKLGPTQVDFIVCPTAPSLPPTLDEVSNQTPVDSYMNDVFTVPASLAGLPAISVPFPIPKEFRVEGKPTFAGIQIIGQYSTDYKVIAMAELVEHTLNPEKLTKRDRQRIRGPLINKLKQESRPVTKVHVPFLRVRRLLMRKNRPEEELTQRKIQVWKVPWLRVRKHFTRQNRLGDERTHRKFQVRKEAALLVKRKFVSRERIILLKKAGGKLFLNSSIKNGRTPKLQIHKVPVLQVRKHFSTAGDNSQLPRGEGDSFLISSGKEGYRFDREIPTNRNSLRPLDEKIRHVYVAQPKGRLPLSEGEINKAFEEAWNAWSQQTSSRSP